MYRIVTIIDVESEPLNVMENLAITDFWVLNKILLNKRTRFAINEVLTITECSVLLSFWLYIFKKFSPQ